MYRRTILDPHGESPLKAADVVGTVKRVREGPTPAETVRAALDDEAFDAVRLALAAVKHGPLAAYTFEKDELVVVAEEAPAAAEAEADGFELVAAA